MQKFAWQSIASTTNRISFEKIFARLAVLMATKSRIFGTNIGFVGVFLSRRYICE